MSAAARETAFLRLSGFVRSVRQDPVFRRRLRHDPDAVLVERGFPAGRSESLPVMPPAEAHLEPSLLFGEGRLEGDVAMPLELRLVLYGVKPLALLHGEEQAMSTLLAASEARGLTALLSAEEWQPVADPALAGYSNLVGETRWARPGSGAWRSLLVGPDEATVSLAWLARTFHWDELLGRLLGYPGCCADAFERRWPEAVARLGGDVAPLAAADSGPGPHPWPTNVLGRYFGHELIQHFPCEFSCAETRRIAVARATALATFEAELLDQTRRVLCAPYLIADGQDEGHFCQNGVVALLGADAHATEAGFRLHLDPSQALATAADGSLARWVAGLGTRIDLDETGRIVSADHDEAAPPLRAVLFAHTGESPA